MSLFKKSLSLAAFVLVVVSGFLVLPLATQAASGDTELTGWAWSSNVGWISLNCNNATDGVRCSTADTTSSEPVSNYRVAYDSATGDFTGFAWNDHIGWITFDPGATGRPTGSGTTAQDAKFMPDTTNCTAKEIKGWAKALTLGSDGWISFSGDTAAPASHYGVCLNPAGNGLSGKLATDSGYAWGSTVIGWIEFNNSLTRNRPTIIEIKPQ